MANSNESVEKLEMEWNLLEEQDAPRNKRHQFWWPPAIVIAFCLIFFLVLLNFKSLPTPMYIKDEPSNPTSFIAERAQNFAETLVAIGPKVAGSNENEKLAVNIIMSAIAEIKAQANPVHVIDYEVQTASGSFFLNYKPNGQASVYQDIQNIVIKLSPREPKSRSSLLINSHFDTVPTSPGAGDAVIMVSVMLETLRVLSKSDTPLTHSVVFLLNGAEENLLQGSHAFITQHTWAPDVKAFINLDSAGNGGKAIMFQAGPENPWLMEHYKKSAPNPYANTMGEEMFQANLIPSDTDFRIFRDFGNIPGIDIAINSNGYVYHTKYDRFDILPLGTYQHIGNNVVALTRSIANSEEMQMLSEGPIAAAEGHVVFYDYLGWFLVFYTESTGIIINSVVVVATLAAIVASTYLMARRNGLPVSRMIREFGICFGVQLLAVIIGAGLTMVLAVVYDAAGGALRWYSQQWLVFGMYLCPLFFGMGIVPTAWLTLRKKNLVFLRNSVQLILHVQAVVYCIMIVAMTALSIRSSFILLNAILFYAITTIANMWGRLQTNTNLWMLVHLVGQIVPFMFFSSITQMSLDTFMPISARGGAYSNPELLIAFNLVGFGLLMAGFIIPLFAMFHWPKTVVSGFIAIFAIFFIIMLTPIGFPYTEETAPQRYWIFHTNREIWSSTGTTLERQDSGYFLLNMDRHSPDPELEALSTSDDCEKEMLCALPFYTCRMFKQGNYSHWLPTTAFHKHSVTLSLESTEILTATRKRFHFKIQGSDHMGIFVSPVSGNELVAWSILTPNDHIVPTAPLWAYDRKTYSVYYGRGVDNENNMSFQFWIDIVSPNSQNAQQVDVAVTGHFMTPDFEKTAQFETFIDNFPKWVHVTAWMSDYKSWKF